MLRFITGFLLAGALVTGCKDTKKEAIPETEVPAKKVFYGKVVIVSRFTAGDTVLSASLSAFSPERMEMYFQQDSFRLIEHGGMSKGNILVYPKLQEAWQLDTVNKLAIFGEYSDLGDPSDALKDLMPDHFAPTVEATNEKITIAGHPCTKYRVVRSGIIPSSDTAYIWAADDMVFPSSRYDIQTEVNQVVVPPNVYLGYEGGAVLRLQVINKRYTRTFEVIELSENNFPTNIFRIPPDYQKK